MMKANSVEKQIERLAERKSAPDEQREKHEKSQDEILADINDGSSVPLSRVAAERIAKRSKKKVSLDDVSRDFVRGRWSEALKKLCTIIFGGAHHVEGIGYLVQKMDDIPLREKRGLLAQIERQDQRKLPLPDRMRTSIMRFELEQALEQSGYEPLKISEPEGTPVRIDTPGTTLKELLVAHAGPTEGKRIWQEISAEQGATPLILGPLNFAELLPQGAYIFFDREGYPLYCSWDATPDEARSSVQLYKRNPEKERALQQLSKQERTMKFLKERLLPGDILLVSQGGNDESPVHEAFEQLVRKISRTDFHASHLLVMNQEGNLFHINTAGKECGTPEDTLKIYNGITVARIKGDRETREAYARHAFERYQELKGFDYAGMVQQGASAATGIDLKTQKKEESLCIDLALDPAKTTNLRKLAKSKTMADIAGCEDVELLYSFDLDKESAAEIAKNPATKK